MEWRRGERGSEGKAGEKACNQLVQIYALWTLINLKVAEANWPNATTACHKAIN